MDKEQFAALVHSQRVYFLSGASMDLSMRKNQLQTLKIRMQQMQGELCRALYLDLGKSENESYIAEIAIVLSEIDYMLKNLKKLSKTRRVSTPPMLFPAKSYIRPEPYGVVLIMSPWNYPVQLTLVPLIAAIASGNCAVIKPSSYAPNVSAAIKRLLSCFPEQYVAVVEGGRAENQALLSCRFDFIFFTGGSFVGRQVLHAAADTLTPCVLELGGKSPCIVLRDADIELAAKRIAFGKLLNAGQTCVAPDYILVEKDVRPFLIDALKRQLATLRPQPLESSEYPRIVNRHHFDRLLSLIRGNIVFGGGFVEETLQIEPTIIDGVTPSHPVMDEEIFGPILPIIEIDSLNDAIHFIQSRPSPLSLYLFTDDKAAQDAVLTRVRFGGGCINDCILHLTNQNLPFGGVGESGMGSYHGKKGFESFSHEKSILQRGKWPDFSMRYMNAWEKYMPLLRWIMRR